MTWCSTVTPWPLTRLAWVAVCTWSTPCTSSRPIRPVAVLLSRHARLQPRVRDRWPWGLHRPSLPGGRADLWARAAGGVWAVGPGPGGSWALVQPQVVMHHKTRPSMCIALCISQHLPLGSQHCILTYTACIHHTAVYLRCGCSRVPIALERYSSHFCFVYPLTEHISTVDQDLYVLQICL